MFKYVINYTRANKFFFTSFQTVGMPMFFHSRMQTNLIMNRLQYNSKIAAFNDVTVPLFWSDMVSDQQLYWIDIENLLWKLYVLITYISRLSLIRFFFIFIINNLWNNIIIVFMKKKLFNFSNMRIDNTR